MDNKLINLTYEVKVKKGEKLTLPDSLLENIGEGPWIITIQPSNEENTIKSICNHDAFLKGYAPEDEGLYDDYPTR